MSSISHRTILHYQAHITPKNENYAGVAPPPMRRCLGSLSNLRHKKEALVTYLKGGETFYVADVKLDFPVTDWATLLINLSDKTEPDPAFSVPETQGYRVERKRQKEGIASSCHIVVSLTPQVNRQDLYRFFIEQRVKMPAAKIQRVLNRLLFIASKKDKNLFLAPDPSGAVDSKGEPKQIFIRPHIELLGDPSDQFIHDVENGSLSNVEMVKISAVTPWDGNGYLNMDRETLRLMPTQSVGAFRQVYDTICSVGKKRDFSQAKVVFTTSSKMQRSVTIDTSTGALAFENYYVRRSQISNFPTLLESSYELIHNPISTKMQQLA